MPATIIKLSKPVSGLRLPDELTRSSFISEPAAEEVDLQPSELEELQDQVTALEAEIQKTREESYNLGFSDGNRSEAEKHSENLKAHAKQIQDLASQLETEYRQVLQSMEEPLLRMSFTIAEKILTFALPDSVRTEALVSTLKLFLKDVLNTGSATIRVSAEDLPYLQGEKVAEELKDRFPDPILFIADPELQPGECILETANQLIDGRLAERLQRLEAELR